MISFISFLALITARNLRQMKEERLLRHCCSRLLLHVPRSCHGVSGQGLQGEKGFPVSLVVVRSLASFSHKRWYLGEGILSPGRESTSWLLIVSRISSSIPFTDGVWLISEGFPFNLGEKWTYLGCLLLLVLGSGNTESGLPSSIGKGLQNASQLCSFSCLGTPTSLPSSYQLSESLLTISWVISMVYSCTL